MARGTTRKTAELVRRATQLRAEGYVFREIGEQLGVSTKVARDWVTDPDGSQLKQRREKYRGTCKACGRRTNGNAGYKAPTYCHSCSSKEARIWTQDTVVMAIRVWADEHGGVPPSAPDWNPNMAIANGRPDKASKFHEDHAWPHVTSVQRVFGSWNAAIEAAGFQPTRQGHYGRDGEDPAVIDETVRLYESGMSLRSVGRAMGVSGEAIRFRLRRAGVSPRPGQRKATSKQDREAA